MIKSGLLYYGTDPLTGALLTATRGIGMVLAAYVYAELSVDAPSKAIRRSVSYAGIVPRSEQTGGSDKPAIQIRVSRRCNHRLKNSKGVSKGVSPVIS